MEWSQVCEARIEQKSSKDLFDKNSEKQNKTKQNKMSKIFYYS